MYEKSKLNDFALSFAPAGIFGLVMMVVAPFISMMFSQLLVVSRLLKGRTRTATFTDDIFDL
jgi:amino acid permease